ncbi:DUF6510 family protein [Cellulomonas endophytica]|uniref:DUF6510 family protein n=1 Tax=Cellulomonas endophytica TaxID=2494735 RepID=UPI001010991D|nr:DUF6510 family protein [Cellulomonas endophytica]
MTGPHPPRPGAGTPAGRPPVDGNAAAGLLGEVLAVEVTTAVAECRGCGAHAPLAQAVVEVDAAGALVRCRGCTRTLLTVLHVPGGVRLEVGCLAALTGAAPTGGAPGAGG